MGPIELSGDETGSVSILSNIFIDHYMPEADGFCVKIYLYLLRCLQAHSPVSIPEIADRLFLTDNDVQRGILYWIRKGIIKQTYDDFGNPKSIVLCHLNVPEDPAACYNIQDFRLLKSERSEAEAPEKNTSDRERLSAAASRTASKESVISPWPVAEEKEASAEKSAQPALEELESALEDPVFLDLKSQAEAFFNRNMSNDDINALWRIYGDLQLPFEVCEYLLEYCATDRENHPERSLPAYYEKVARNWKEHGIRSREEAKRFTQEYFFGTKLLRALGVRDRYLPTDAENRMLEDWRNRYHFSDDMLLLACERAIIRKPGSAGFGYVGGILESWYRKGIKTPEDVEREALTAAEQPKKSAGNAFMSRSSSDDLNIIEQLAMKN